MKVLYLHQYFVSPEMSGGSRSYFFAKHLVDSGHNVTIVSSRSASSGDARFQAETVIDGISVIWVPVSYSNKMNPISRILAFIKFAVSSIWYSRKVRPDVVFATSTPLTIAIPGLAISKWRGVPLVFEVRDLWPDVPIQLGFLNNYLLISAANFLERMAYSQSKKIIALSPGMARGVLSKGVIENKVVTLPNMADVEMFQVARRESSNFFDGDQLKGKKIVLYAGALGYVNDVSYIVKLAKRTLDQSETVAFVVIGDGAETELVKRLAAEQGVLKNNFFMYEPVPKAQIATLFAMVTATISTVRDVQILEDNSANKFFDSLAAGKPIFVNYGGWQAELLEEYGIGRQLDRDCELAAEQVVEFLGNLKEVKAAGARALKLANSRFSKAETSRKFEQLLLDTCERGG
jgi:glycosyltransferase involved in cell wall biosynthesis